MRMSVLVELPGGKFKLYCKGADSAIFPLAVNDERSQKESMAAANLAAEGLRTLVFAERKLSKEFVDDWLKKDKSCQKRW
jgi:magnesium-transporting ATPase (P-type)